MKSWLVVAGIALFVPWVALAGDAHVSVTMGAPGFYGRIDVGGLPHPPALIFPHPVVIAPVPIGVPVPAPVYFHVPPGHEKNWAKHCGAYHACGRPVFFVRNAWYNDVYVPAYREKHGHGGEGHGNGHGGGNSHGGNGHGHGKK